jgi:acetylornithine/N-succinyldiaminopimelate aminotransferase
VSNQESAIFPSYARYPITMVKGAGSRLWDSEGKEYLDLMSGLAVTSLGHSPKRVVEKVKAQLDQLWHVSNLFHTENQEKLARMLADNSCADAVFFCNSGAEANEAAIKLARRYNSKILGNSRYEIITFHQSFHGRTLATLTATGQDKVKEGFHPLPEGFVYAPYNDAAALASYITEKTCAIMLEMVQAEGGVISAEQDFVDEIVKLCKEHDLLLIVDEVQTGMGRTGKLFAYEHYGIEPDIFTLAKGIATGLPMGAMLGKAKLRDAFTAGAHASTFGGTPLVASAAIATLEVILEDKLSEHAAELGEYAMAKLREGTAGNPLVKEVRGKGLLIGVLCVQPMGEAISDIHKAGVLVVPAGPNVVRLLPNLLVTHEEIDEGVAVICDVLAKHAEKAAVH